MFLDLSIHPKCPEALKNPVLLKAYPIKEFLNLIEYLGYIADMEAAAEADEKSKNG